MEKCVTAGGKCNSWNKLWVFRELVTPTAKCKFSKEMLWNLNPCKKVCPVKNLSGAKNILHSGVTLLKALKPC
jgi:hypothetical protein